MKEHFENIKFLYGNAGVRLPNDIFRDLSNSINANNQQIAFSYVYCVAISFLYKYASFVDLDKDTYIQNSDIKVLLGYNKGTKTVDKIIKKNGILDELGLTLTTKDYPVDFTKDSKEKINGIALREFVTISELNANSLNYNTIKRIVKNRNYEVKEPLFLTSGYNNNEFGTLYSIECTHQITIDEFLYFISNNELNNIDFLLYAFFKYKCKGYKNNMKSLPLYKITSELGMSTDTLYKHLALAERRGLIQVFYKGWNSNSAESNEYVFKGVF